MQGQNFRRITRESPVVSVIIVNWNGMKFLPRCLASLHAQTLHNFQVILVDNASTDESVAYVKEKYAGVNVLELGENLGYAEANNRAAALSQAEYLLFLNNDTYIDVETLDELVAAAEVQPAIPIWAPQQRTYDGTRATHMGLGMDVLGFPCGGKVFYADGAAIFVRRDAFQQLEGFDAHYFMFFEEADLCWRARLQGYQIGVVPKAIVYHQGGGTAGASVVNNGQYITNSNKRRLGHRNQLITLLKNYSLPTLCVALPLFGLLTAVEVMLLAIAGQQRAVRESYVLAWLDLIHDRSYICTARNRVQSTRRVADGAILQHMEWKLAVLSLFFRVGIPKIEQ